MIKQAYDIVGDIHGEFLSLQALLLKLGYTKRQGVFSHPQRKVIFLGDFIDRGPAQLAVIELVRSMVDFGSAFSVMGNHEFNAIAYATKHPHTKQYLRAHSTVNLNQHTAFLNAFSSLQDEYYETIDWFKTLPLWLDLGDLRVIHACWDAALINKLGSPELTESLLLKASDKTSAEYKAIKTLIKGKQVSLENGLSYKDEDSNPRKSMRVRWWDPSATTYQSSFVGSDRMRACVPNHEMKEDHFVDYGDSEPPVFIGHYWFHGTPEAMVGNIACVDYSVAKRGGKLVAYRWDGEQVLLNDKFVWVDKIE
ncbi:Diadenosine tetraphosphatase and related serine/threonine protein phosphatases [hydrothermal vent metagenome]|uniref:Diadenosine tetraphosphatase and related serine/threonine protein phosphatases n=1 Tax=hydrothermal vent metagenome TaxID=652676 RepID=A0A3B0Y0R7_9ZZZZ